MYELEDNPPIRFIKRSKDVMGRLKVSLHQNVYEADILTVAISTPTSGSAVNVGAHLVCQEAMS